MLPVYPMRKLTPYGIALFFAGLCLIAAIFMAFRGEIANAGPFLIIFFVALGIGFRGYAPLRGLSYTIMIFAAVTTALYYPQYFTQAGDFKLTNLITPLIQLIMFGMGTSMSVQDFVAVVKTP